MRATDWKSTCALADMLPDRWKSVCALAEILPDSGVCAELGGRQIALFRVDDAVYALDNRDPASGANVLSRGIVGDLEGELVVASPLYKHHYSLATGRCLEDASLAVDTYLARVVDHRVWVAPRPALRRRALRRKLVVIGNGMAGMRTVEELLAIAPQACEITVFGAEPHGNYNRILLSPVLAGDTRREDIVLHPPPWYQERGITLHTGDPVIAIDRRRRLVTAQSGRTAPYDRLLLATGSSPLTLPIPGATLPGVVSFRDLADVDAMLGAARPGAAAVVIGGGLLGLEAAEGLRRRGMTVTVVHLFDTLMERQLDQPAAQLLQASLEQRGIRFRMQAQTTAVLGDRRASGLAFADGTELAADLVVMAAGIRPNIALARKAGLRCERGVLVDDTLQTFDPAIYAVGECVQHRNTTYGLVAPLWEQARVCAAHLAEHGVRDYRGSLVSTRLKVTGIEVFSAGDFRGETAGAESLVLRDQRRGIYKRVVIADERLRGAVLYGDTRDAQWYLDLMHAARPLGALRETLLFGAAYAASAS